MSLLPPHIKAAITRFDEATRRYGAELEAPSQSDDHWWIYNQHERARESLERAIEKAISR